jgi:hypothetical protein
MPSFIDASEKDLVVGSTVYTSSFGIPTYLTINSVTGLDKPFTTVEDWYAKGRGNPDHMIKQKSFELTFTNNPSQTIKATLTRDTRDRITIQYGDEYPQILFKDNAAQKGGRTRRRTRRAKSVKRKTTRRR